MSLEGVPMTFGSPSPEEIEVEGFEAVGLLHLDHYPITHQLYEAAAQQADAAILREAGEITDLYHRDLSEPLIQRGHYRATELARAIEGSVYARLRLRADIGPFVKYGTITPDNRGDLFVYRPGFNYEDTTFTFPLEMADDLQPYYEALLAEQEDDSEYTRLTGLHDDLEGFTSDAMVAVQPREIHEAGLVVSYIKDWSSAIRHGMFI